MAGHAIWQGCDASEATKDDDWILEDMQRGGPVRTYLKHIVKGCVGTALLVCMNLAAELLD